MVEGNLYKHENGTIVMYTGNILGYSFSGVVIYKDEEMDIDTFDVGHYSENWDKRKFVEYIGMLTLKNK